MLNALTEVGTAWIAFYGELRTTVHRSQASPVVDFILGSSLNKNRTKAENRRLFPKLKREHTSGRRSHRTRFENTPLKPQCHQHLFSHPGFEVARRFILPAKRDGRFRSVQNSGPKKGKNDSGGGPS
jgi:hypothetical protein